MRNEFMAAWDGLRSKDSQRIVILAATNRPFDLDDAVIRRLPRRIYVDLSDVENRTKILWVIHTQEKLVDGVELNELASATEGYLGSDLKNLCIAAAYMPIQELLEEEKMLGKQRDSTLVLWRLTLDDFIQAKAKHKSLWNLWGRSLEALSACQISLPHIPRRYWGDIVAKHNYVIAPTLTIISKTVIKIRRQLIVESKKARRGAHKTKGGTCFGRRGRTGFITSPNQLAFLHVW
eukprot:Gb_08234 [translate_table: standard]